MRLRRTASVVNRHTPQTQKPPCGGLNGCPTKEIRNWGNYHDIIELFEKPTSLIYEKIKPLRDQSLSISEISRETGIKRTAIWSALKSFEPPTKRSDPSRYARWRKGHQRTGARPPYGYCVLLGDVVPEPKEYPTLLLIHRLWKNDEAIMSILEKLEERGLKSRTGKKWSYGVIRFIIERFEKKAIVHKHGKLVLYEKFLTGIVLPTKNINSKRRLK